MKSPPFRCCFILSHRKTIRECFQRCLTLGGGAGLSRAPLKKELKSTPCSLLLLGAGVGAGAGAGAAFGGGGGGVAAFKGAAGVLSTWNDAVHASVSIVDTHAAH